MARTKPVARIPSGVLTRAGLRNKRLEKHALIGNGHRHAARVPKSVNASRSKPPPGYTFLTVGYPDLAERCRDISADKGADFKQISAAKNVAGRIATQLHRIGYHIRTDIFDEACAELSYRIENGKLTRDLSADVRGFERAFGRYGVDLQQEAARKATDEEAQRVQATIKELFPLIPEKEAQQIFNRAWQKGSKNIGRQTDVPMARRVQLAVAAHIRHQHTNYDHLLNQKIAWGEARKTVEPETIRKLREWIGDEQDEEFLRDTLEGPDIETPAEYSEPDRYGDNEDSSEGEIFIEVNPRRAAELERPPSAYGSGNDSSRPHSAFDTRRRDPDYYQSSFEQAPSHPGYPVQPDASPSTHFSQYPHPHLPEVDQVSMSQYRQEPYQAVQSEFNIRDHHSRAQPANHATSQTESMHESGATRSRLSKHRPMPAAYEQTRFQTTAFTGSHPVPSQQPGKFFDQRGHEIYVDPATHLLPPPISGKNVLVEDLPPQKFFDETGQEIMIDPDIHELVPLASDHAAASNHATASGRASTTGYEPLRALGMPAARPSFPRVATIAGSAYGDSLDDTYEPPSAITPGPNEFGAPSNQLVPYAARSSPVEVRASRRESALSGSRQDWVNPYRQAPVSQSAKMRKWNEPPKPVMRAGRKKDVGKRARRAATKLDQEDDDDDEYDPARPQVPTIVQTPHLIAEQRPRPPPQQYASPVYLPPPPPQAPAPQSIPQLAVFDPRQMAAMSAPRHGAPALVQPSQQIYQQLPAGSTQYQALPQPIYQMMPPPPPTIPAYYHQQVPVPGYPLYYTR